jgi:hypothetical protein
LMGEESQWSISDLLRAVGFRDAVSILLLTSIAIGPIAGPANAAVDDRLGDTAPPEDCIDSPIAHSVAAQNTTPGKSNAVSGVINYTDPENGTVKITYEINETYSGRFEVQPLRLGNVVSSNGFNGQYGYVWDGSTRTPSITLEPTGYSRGPQPANFTNGEDWILGPVPKHEGASVTFQPDNSGYIGSQFFYLGPYERFTTTAGCQRIGLIVPEAADQHPAPSRLLSMYNAGARSLDMGHTYDEVTGFVAPVSGSPHEAGVARKNEFLVGADNQLRSASNVWIHEYVHTRQGFRGTLGAQWFREGSATYLAARFSLEQGLISPRRYDAALANAVEYTNQSNVQLNAAQNGEVAYQGGLVVLSRVDAALASSNRSVLDLLRWMNNQNPPRVGQRETERWVRGNATDEALQGFDYHAAVFSSTPPKPAYVLTEKRGPMVDILVALETPFVRGIAGFMAILLTFSVIKDLSETDDSSE